MVCIFIDARKPGYWRIPLTALCFQTLICKSRPTVDFIKAVNALQSLFNWLFGVSQCEAYRVCLHNIAVCQDARPQHHNQTRLIVVAWDLIMSYCSLYLSLRLFCRVNGTICSWMWNGTTASQKCPTLCISTWCRTATMKMVRRPFVLQRKPWVNVLAGSLCLFVFLTNTHICLRSADTGGYIRATCKLLFQVSHQDGVPGD